ncbi:hypothetical protein D3C76_1666910 [compost metagenome]
MWWMRRPALASRNPVLTLCQCWLSLPASGRGVTLFISVMLGMMMPVMGFSLAFFVLIDWLRWRAQSLLSLSESTK